MCQTEIHVSPEALPVDQISPGKWLTHSAAIVLQRTGSDYFLDIYVFVVPLEAGFSAPPSLIMDDPVPRAMHHTHKGTSIAVQSDIQQSGNLGI